MLDIVRIIEELKTEALSNKDLYVNVGPDNSFVYIGKVYKESNVIFDVIEYINGIVDELKSHGCHSIKDFSCDYEIAKRIYFPTDDLESQGLFIV